jgi:uncharacterized protein YcbX
MTDAIPVIATELFVYPVKSCAAMRVESLAFDDDGLLVGDREWVVVDDQDCVVWQGSHPKLALVQPRMDQGILTLQTSLGDQVVLAPHSLGAPVRIKIWNDSTQHNDVHDGLDAGQEAAEFLQCTVGAKLRLVRLGRAAMRREGAQRVHLVSQSSYDELCECLPPGTLPPADLLRFRPNIVVRGCGDPLIPFLEDQFTQLSWHTGTYPARLVVQTLCVRCIVPNVDPLNAQVDERVLQAVIGLSAERHPGAPVVFGIYAQVEASATLTRGTTLDAVLNF